MKKQETISGMVNEPSSTRENKAINDELGVCGKESQTVEG